MDEKSEKRVLANAGHEMDKKDGQNTRFPVEKSPPSKKWIFRGEFEVEQRFCTPQKTPVDGAAAGSRNRKSKCPATSPI